MPSPAARAISANAHARGRRSKRSFLAPPTCYEEHMACPDGTPASFSPDFSPRGTTAFFPAHLVENSSVCSVPLPSDGAGYARPHVGQRRVEGRHPIRPIFAERRRPFASRRPSSSPKIGYCRVWLVSACFAEPEISDRDTTENPPPGDGRRAAAELLA